MRRSDTRSRPRSAARPLLRLPVWGVLLGLVAGLPADGSGQGLTPGDVVGLKRVDDVAMSPDGSRIAFTLTVPRTAGEPVGHDHSQLWLVGADGEGLRRATTATRSASAPAWSPDGGALAFLARLEPDPDHDQVYGIDPDGGAPTLLARSPTGIVSYAWSPDGSRIAYRARAAPERGAGEAREAGFDAEVAGEAGRPVRLWVTPVEGGGRRALTSARWTVRSFIWSPDGDRLAVQVTDDPRTDAGYMYRRLHTVPARGGELAPVAETEGKLGAMAFSPDGRRLAFLGATSLHDPLAQSVFVVPADGGPPVNVTPGYEGSATWVGWLDDDAVAFVASEGTRTALNRVPASGGEVTRIAGGGAEVFGSVSPVDGGGRFAAVASTASHPDEVHVGGVADGALERITRHNPWLDERRLALQETVEWTGADGWRIEGVLVHPLDEAPGGGHPLVILPHGGPEGVSQDGWTTRSLYPAQLLAARGYAVLMPNYRGSAGRGVAFSEGDHRDLGGEEFLDVLAGVDYLAETGLVDPGRVGISGTSYGGYFAAWAATKHSDRFRAAIPTAGISNWISFTGTTDIPVEMSMVHWDLWWFDNPGLAWDRSPLAHVEDASTPTLIVHGTEDERVHPEQSLELYTALRMNGVPTELVRYPREPHGLTERAHRLDFMRRVTEWLERHVKNAPGAGTDDDGGTP